MCIVLQAKTAQERSMVEKLCAAGYDTPRKLQAASDKDLLAVSGVGTASLQMIRERA